MVYLSVYMKLWCNVNEIIHTYSMQNTRNTLADRESNCFNYILPASSRYLIMKIMTYVNKFLLFLR